MLIQYLVKKEGTTKNKLRDFYKVKNRKIMNSIKKNIQFSSEEYTEIGNIAKPFWENGISEKTPKFVIFMGGVGVGKTTIRRQKYSEGYVNFEFAEILNAIKTEFGEDNPKLTGYAQLAGDMILQESIEAKKNIVIEIIGENYDVVIPVINKIEEIGYKVEIQAIGCDPEEAYKRHVKAVKEDPEYLSAHFTQEATLSFFYHQFELGEIPKAST